MNTIRLDTFTPEGRRVAVWRTSPSVPGPGRPVAVIAPGFGRSMANLASVSLYLTANGVTTYRFDPLDHVGLSDGEIGDYTLGATLDSYQAVLRLARGQEPWSPITVVGVSMSGRAALRAAGAPCVRRLVTLVGVVDVVATLTEVFGSELVTRAAADLPDQVRFEEHWIRPQAIHAECHAGWGRLEDALADLAALPVPAVAVYATGDPWVPAWGIERAFQPGPGGAARHLVGVPSDVHDLGEDPPAALEALELLTAAVVSTDPCRPDAVVVPSTDELLDVIADEMAWELDELAVSR